VAGPNAPLASLEPPVAEWPTGAALLIVILVSNSCLAASGLALCVPLTSSDDDQ
jgi:hypothetical protein